jgi:thiamine kinase-like enzyme
VGFCHWDLKLDNICFDDGRYFLIDFAYAQRIKRSYPITAFKGNSMFASIRKFRMNARAHPIDDIESLLYLLCFCFDGFYLPWL